MAEIAGFHEVIPQVSYCPYIQQNVNINTGASQSTLHDIKVPDYGGGFVYHASSPLTRNRYIFWRVSNDSLELWEESLEYDLTNNSCSLRIVGLPLLEGVSVHETDRKQVVLLFATIASTHCITLTHPDILNKNSDGVTNLSVFGELEQHNLREIHAMHLMATPAVEGGKALPCSTAMLNDSTAAFLFGQPSAALLLLTMSSKPAPPVPAPITISGLASGVASSSSSSSAVTTLIKNTSLVNRFFKGFVSGVFKGSDDADAVNNISCVVFSASGDSSRQVFGVGVCGDGRLRLWCLRRRECVLIRDTLEDAAEAASRHTPHGERHVVACRSLEDGSSAVVAVHLSFVEKQLLLLYRLIAENVAANSSATGAPVALVHLKTLYPPHFHLVNMALTSTHVWTLWSDTNNGNQVLYSSIEGGLGLLSAILQQLPDKVVHDADNFLDHREICLKELFAPYQFAPHTVAKALSIYRSCSVTETSIEALREKVESTLQAQIEGKTLQGSSNQELIDLSVETWQNFYSHTLQYHQVGMKGLGLVCGSSGAVAVVRRKAVSYMSQVDALEAMVAAAMDATPHQDLTQVVIRCGGTTVLCGDSSAAANVAGVLRCVTIVRRLMDEDVAAAFLLDMAHHSHPEVVAEDVATSLMRQVVGGDEVSCLISNAVSSIPNFPSGLRLLLRALSLDCFSIITTDESEPLEILPSSRCQLLCSLITGALHQVAHSRLLLCRDLLVLQQLSLQLAPLCHLSPDYVGQLRTSIVQDTVLVSRAYHALLCLARAPAVRPSSRHIYATRRLVAALGLQDSPTTLLTPLPSSSGVPATALQAVLQQGACPQLSCSTEQDSELMRGKKGVWVWEALGSVRTLTRLAWPLQDRGGSTTLLESLVFSGQVEAALSYIRQVRGWCEWSLYSRHFLLGVCLLLQGQHRKAARLLQEAGEGSATEPLLAERIAVGSVTVEDDASEYFDSGRVQYTLRLVRLFEVFGQPALALRLASGALCLSQQHSGQQLSQLYAVLFKHHLALGHHDEAFTALLENPDPGPQRACLRQLLVALYQQGCLSKLVNYEYGNLTSDVITILENRARSADILSNNYYHVLYSFHIHKENYKKAASVMYECAWRLGIEGVGETSLKQQMKCYLACINALKLLPKHAAWIIKPNPVPAVDCDVNDEQLKTSEREMLGEKIAKTRRKKIGVEVLELQHIDREYQLVHALLALSAASPDTHISPGLLQDPSATVALLCHGRLFREASCLCSLFELSAVPVIQALAATCVLADESGDKQQHSAWLKHNGIANTTSGWWELLREMLRAEKGRLTELHRVAAAALLNHGRQIPPWLFDSYTRRDSGELLKVMLQFGHLEAAGELALRLLDAVTQGTNADKFGLQAAIHSTGEDVCLPYTALDRLTLELKSNKNYLFYDKMYTQLQNKLRLYQSTLDKVSKDAVLLMASR